MALYKEYKNDENVLVGYIIATDNAFIPIDEENRDYKRFLDWVAEGMWSSSRGDGGKTSSGNSETIEWNNW